MAANLVRSYTSERAHHLLNLSFAQYQADGDVVRIEARLDRRQTHLAELLERSQSPYGDVDEYRREMKAPEQPPAAGGAVGRDDLVTLALLKLRPGDVIYAEKARYAGRVAVLASAHRKGGMRVTGLTARRELVMLTALDFEEPPRALGKIELPADYAPNRHDFQKEVVHRLELATLSPHSKRARRAAAVSRSGSHPVEDDPELEDRLKAAAQAERVAREIEELRARVRNRSQSVARDFDRVLRVLENWGYVDGWALTDAGKILARTFHECDLLIVECLRQGLLDGLEPAALAGLVSVFVYEHRSPEAPPTAWFPSPTVRKRWQRIAEISYELEEIEEEAGLSVHRPPDPTFVAVAYAWAAGEGFAEVVEAEELSGGDFVRTMKQLIDVLRQVAIVAPERETRLSAEQAADQLFRGVVAASSAVEVEDETDVEGKPLIAEQRDDDPQG
jgi:ATP-dependent RNA helicase HelY